MLSSFFVHFQVEGRGNSAFAASNNVLKCVPMTGITICCKPASKNNRTSMTTLNSALNFPIPSYGLLNEEGVDHQKASNRLAPISAIFMESQPLKSKVAVVASFVNIQYHHP
jgi:hypothetical protein